ncbi:hypothetical protein [Rouxiella chamberiensis]|uniref:Bacteriocin n=1 Tax=Rouxiella chamberiensis TaxID=1513468 RepID=A0ABY7HT62_9GAMM|nr:hypothetical protein [Rouxiella chamberiensis]WAT02586.1 hypothetical protein O1V66_08530 [Rouxiella chamberiensis]
MNSSIREINVDEIAQVSGGGLFDPAINLFNGVGDTAELVAPVLTQAVQVIAEVFYDAGTALGT